MTNEIKEILDRLNENKDYDDYVDYKGSYFKPLLDYITNLQEENNLQNESILFWKSKCDNLQEENRKLKELKYKFFDCSCDEESFTLEDYLELGNKLYDLQEENERLKDLYRRTIEHLFKIGNDELARYFQAQINDCPSFVPQDLRGDE